jgi:hypothetical protein
MEPSNDIFRQEYTKVTPENSRRILEIKQKAQELWNLYESVAKSGAGVRMGSPTSVNLRDAEKALEESVMWAIKGISDVEFNPENAEGNKDEAPSEGKEAE